MTSPAPEATTSRAMTRLQRTFAAIWLSYDVLDVSFGCTNMLLVGLAFDGAQALVAAQLLLIATGAATLVGVRPNLCLAIAALARLGEAWLFPLNDFWYAALMAAYLAAVPTPSSGASLQRTRRWAQVMLAQLAWIYVATATLKLNPEWLRGGDMYVRQNVLAASGWPYPAFWLPCMHSLTCNAVLGWLGIAAELALGALLALYALKRWRRVGQLTCLLCGGIHLFAALATNVWFFGASMFAQVYWLVRAADDSQS